MPFARRPGSYASCCNPLARGSSLSSFRHRAAVEIHDLEGHSFRLRQPEAHQTECPHRIRHARQREARGGRILARRHSRRGAVPAQVVEEVAGEIDPDDNEGMSAGSISRSGRAEVSQCDTDEPAEYVVGV